MLRSPRRLPQRYNRPVTPQMRRLAERRLNRRKEFRSQKWKRTINRLQRRAGSLRKIAIQFASLIVGGLVLLMIGLALFSPILHIKDIVISRSDPRIDAPYVASELAPLYNKHLFFLTNQEVISLLEKAVPDLHGAQITKEYPSSLRIRITLDPIIAKLTIEGEAPPVQEPAAGTGAVATGTGSAAVGSGNTILSQGESYLTNEGMHVMYLPSQVQTESGQSLLQLTVVDWGVRPEPWQMLVDAAFLEAMQQAESELKNQFSLTIRSRKIYVRAREFHLQAPQYALWFDLRSPLQEQLLRYRTFQQSPGAKNAKEYVDLRLKDKIVYK
jgi:hypothetical protein